MIEEEGSCVSSALDLIKTMNLWETTARIDDMNNNNNDKNDNNNDKNDKNKDKKLLLETQKQTIERLSSPLERKKYHNNNNQNNEYKFKPNIDTYSRKLAVKYRNKVKNTKVKLTSEEMELKTKCSFKPKIKAYKKTNNALNVSYIHEETDSDSDNDDDDVDIINIDDDDNNQNNQNNQNNEISNDLRSQLILENDDDDEYYNKDFQDHKERRKYELLQLKKKKILFQKEQARVNNRINKLYKWNEKAQNKKINQSIQLKLRKEKEELLGCSFKPVINKKILSSSSSSSSFVNKKEVTKIEPFHLKTEEYAKRLKKKNKNNINNHLHNNDDILNKSYDQLYINHENLKSIVFNHDENQNNHQNKLIIANDNYSSNNNIKITQISGYLSSPALQ